MAYTVRQLRWLVPFEQERRGTSRLGLVRPWSRRVTNGYYCLVLNCTGPYPYPWTGKEAKLHRTALNSVAQRRRTLIDGLWSIRPVYPSRDRGKDVYRTVKYDINRVVPTRTGL